MNRVNDRGIGYARRESRIKIAKIVECEHEPLDGRVFQGRRGFHAHRNMIHFSKSNLFVSQSISGSIVIN